MHVKQHCLTFIGFAKNVDLWFAWIVTRPKRGRVLEVCFKICMFIIYLKVKELQKMRDLPSIVLLLK